MEQKIVVRKMQDYLLAHLNEPLDAEALGAYIGYSARHCERLFKQYTGKTIPEYQRLLRLTGAAKTLQSEREATVLDVALRHQYESHEGFTKAFRSAFGVTPSAYRSGMYPIPYFVPYPVYTPQKGYETMPIVTVTTVHKPRRTLLYLPSKAGTDYWSFCQEKGCDWEGLLNSIAGRMDTAAFITFPPNLRPEGWCEGAAAIELPEDYAGLVPEGYETMPMPETDMLYFESERFADEDDFGLYIDAVFKAYEQYDPARFGYAFAPEAAPVFNFGAAPETGGRLAVPVKLL